MKIRLGHVSNSSSSSFIIIGTAKPNIPKLDIDVLKVPGHFGGEIEFGWGPEEISDIGSRLNFAYLQTLYSVPYGKDLLQIKAEESLGIIEPRLQMLEELLKSELCVKEIQWDLNSMYKEYNAYIDHQSTAGAGENTEIFDSIDCLRNFIFSDDSLINLDNDNY